MACLKHELYESFYPEHKDNPITISDYVEKLNKVIQELKASTPRKPMIEWSSKEMQRWTSNLPIKGLKEVAEEILASMDGADLASFTEEDLKAAGMASKIHRKQLVKARDMVLQRDRKANDGKAEADDGFGQALGLLSGSMGEGEMTVQQAEAFELLAGAATKSKKLGEATSLLRKALEVRESVQGDDHIDVAAACDRLAAILEMQDKEAEAEDLLWRALKITEAAAPGSDAVVTCIERLMVLLDKQGRSAECADLVERADSIKTSPAIQILRDYVTPDNVRKGFLYTLAAVLFLQIVAPEFLDPFLEVLPGTWRYQYKYQASKVKLAVWERYHGEGHAAMTPYLMDMAQVYESGGKAPEAYSTYDRVVAICKEQGIGRDPIAALALSSMGRMDATAGDLDQAHMHLSKAIGIYTTTGDVFDIMELSFAQGQLGEVLRQKGKYREALPLFKQAVGVMEANEYAIDDGDRAITLAGYGSTLAQVGEKELAAQVTMQAVNLTRRMFIRAINSEMLNMVLEAGETMEAMGDHIEAGGFFKQAADIAMKVKGVTDETVARALASLATCLFRVEGKGKEAELMSRESVRIAQAGLGVEHPRVAYYFIRRGGLLAAAGRIDEAEDVLSAGHGILDKAGKSADPKLLAMYHTNMGGIAMSRGEVDEAVSHIRQVLAIREEILGPTHPSVGDAASNLAVTLASKGMVEEAMENVAKAEAAWLSAYGEEQGTSRTELLKARINSYIAEAAKKFNDLVEEQAPSA